MKRKTPTLVTTAILTVITVFMWIALSVYQAFIKVPPVNIPPEVLAPVSPVLDKDILASLSQKTYFNEGEVPAVFKSSGETPQGFGAIPTGSASLTVTPIPTQPATGSGQISP